MARTVDSGREPGRAQPVDNRSGGRPRRPTVPGMPAQPISRVRRAARRARVRRSRSCSGAVAPGEVWRAVPRRGGPAGRGEGAASTATRSGRRARPRCSASSTTRTWSGCIEVVHQPRAAAATRVALVLDLLGGRQPRARCSPAAAGCGPGEVVTAIAPVAAALAHAHAHGVVHGDLSPGNIVFTAEGRPVLTDLGVGTRARGDSGRRGHPALRRPDRGARGRTRARPPTSSGSPPPRSTRSPASRRGTPPPRPTRWPWRPPATCPTSPSWRPRPRRSWSRWSSRGLSADPHERGSAAAFALDLRHACRPEPVRLPVTACPTASSAGPGAARAPSSPTRCPGAAPRPAPVVVRGARPAGPAGAPPGPATGGRGAAGPPSLAGSSRGARRVPAWPVVAVAAVRSGAGRTRPRTVAAADLAPRRTSRHGAAGRRPARAAVDRRRTGRPSSPGCYRRRAQALRDRVRRSSGRRVRAAAARCWSADSATPGTWPRPGRRCAASRPAWSRRRLGSRTADRVRAGPGRRLAGLRGGGRRRAAPVQHRAPARPVTAVRMVLVRSAGGLADRERAAAGLRQPAQLRPSAARSADVEVGVGEDEAGLLQPRRQRPLPARGRWTGRTRRAPR